MAKVFMADPSTGRCALYDEPTTSGDPQDPNSARNSPLNSPVSNLQFVYFHSDFNYMEVSHGPTTVAVAHASVPVGGTSFPESGASIAFGWKATSANHVLLTHSLGYIPHAMVVVAGNVLWPGMPVQVASDGGSRYVSAYCTTTQVVLYEWASSGATTLPATSLNYTVLVFRNPPAPTGNILIDFDPVTGDVEMGRGQFDSSRRYLQVVPGGSPFGIAYGRTIDLNNGAPRAVRPDGTVFNPVPTTLRLGLTRLQGYPTVYGASMAYGGSFTGPTQILVQAP